MKPKCGHVITLLVRFSSAADAAEVANQFKGRQGIKIPGELKALGEGVWRGIGNHVKEKIQTRVAAGKKGCRVVFGEAHRGIVGEGVKVGDHKVHEGVAFGGGGGRRRGTCGGRWSVNLRWAEERTGVRSHIGRSWLERLLIMMKKKKKKRSVNIGERTDGVYHIYRRVSALAGY